MTFHPRLTAVVGATGPVGFHLVRELAGRGWAVRAVSRRPERLAPSFADAGVEAVAADAMDREALRRALAGSELVVDAIGLPPERMADHPRTAGHLVAEAAAAGARCLQVSSYWAFLPHRSKVVDEEHPRQGGHEWFRLRRAAEDVFLTAGGAVVHLPDFFGPRVHTSSVQMALEGAVAGGRMDVLGGADVEREIVYVPDAARLVADLAARREAYGTDWGLPGNGVASPRELARIASEHLGRDVRVRAAPPWLVRLLALVVASMRPAVPLAPHYARPVRYRTAKLRGLLGEVEMRPLREAVEATLDWIVAQERS